jgi:ubiquinone/menaquinone biosynthesis C-methylase UbiE
LDAAARIEPWDRYWAYGYLHSCSGCHAGNYRGAIAAHWHERFAALPANSRIGDIAAGNGALALLALDTAEAQGLDFIVEAADLAAIDPPAAADDADQHRRLERIRFHPRTPAEALPWADGALDCAVSQFGLEYSDLDRSLAEVARVLTSAGRFHAVMHHTGSVMLAGAGDEIARIDRVVEDERLYLKMRNYLRALREIGRARAGQHRKVAKKRRAVDAALERIDQAAWDSADAAAAAAPARYVRELLAASERERPQTLLDWLEEALSRVQANRARLEDMRAAAVAPAGVPALVERLRGAGLSAVEVDALAQDDGSVLGWRVDARRA